MDNSWKKVCSESDLQENVPRLVTIGKEGIYLVRLDGKIHAVGHECPHYQCKLEEGLLLGRVVVCRCHNARLDVTTGRMVSPPALNDLTLYPVRVEEGDVWVGPAEKPKHPRVQVSENRTFLIVGAGAAGNAAAETLRREGFAGRIVMVTSEADQPYDRPNLSKEFLAGKAKPEWLPLRSPSFYEDQGIEVLTNHRVVAFDGRKKEAVFEGGKVMSFDKALLATGGTPRKLSIPGAKEGCCFSLRSLADARAIEQAASTAKSAALIGAGFIGMELASSLRERGLSVTVISPESLPLARVLGDRIAALLKKRHEDNGAVLHLGKTVTRIAEEKGAKVLVLSDGSRVTPDFVVFGLGVQPAVEYISGTELVLGGVIPVNARLQTRIPDVFAAGDIALIPDPLGTNGNGEELANSVDGQRVEHWVAAERMGCHAARAMLGSQEPYREAQFFWTRQTGIGVKYVGYVREWDKIVYRGDVEGGKFIAGFYVRGALKAAAGVGLANDISAIEELFRRRIPVPAEKLSDTGFDLQALARG